ncbi:Mitochondrial carrier protein [Hondaea fermentalgiana]|uniref:Mitochondrial carrier protein n=1 Tax=Hondaea fermentalgiana TaxID=2315210 RepID=A0A2R5G9C2_9STRA|nr:Mitochondrial carrier protein [Hondaea fermentalgiana]|eukprot:GBG24661.1 Mitochondrial carrier protein [Hondaea fermentalgiana]
MVLRGSNIAPGSLQEAEAAVKRAQELLDQAKADLEQAKDTTLEALNEDTIINYSKEELVDIVKKLNAKVVKLEERELQAENAMVKSRIELQKTMTSLACGGAAGAIARSTVAPLDRVKILMQTSHLQGTEAKYGSVLGTARQIIKDEGVMRLWRGNLTNCVRVVPHTATQFVSYDKYKSLLLNDGEKMTVPVRLMAGALSGMTAATVTHPMDVVRIRLQTQAELRGIGDAIRSVYAENGLRTFYKGYTPAMLSLSPFIAINFASFDTLKTWYYGDVKMNKKELQARNPAVILGLGACAGIIAQTACYPLDTVRRRMQLAGKNYSSTINAFATILKDEGPLGYYKGMSANAMKVVPNNAIRFAAFEVLKSWFMTDDALKRTATKFRSTRNAKPATA